MSYELVLLPCPSELSGAAATEWFEEYQEPEDELDLSAAALAAWDGIVAAARGLLPDGEVEASSEHAELRWPDPGLVLEYWPDEATIGLEYWHDGPAAGALVATVYRLAEIVQQHTGLRAFDTQLDLLVDEARVADAVDAYVAGRALGSRA